MALAVRFYFKFILILRAAFLKQKTNYGIL